MKITRRQLRQIIKEEFSIDGTKPEELAANSMLELGKYFYDSNNKDDYRKSDALNHIRNLSRHLSSLKTWIQSHADKEE